MKVYEKKFKSSKIIVHQDLVKSLARVWFGSVIEIKDQSLDVEKWGLKW